MKSLTNIYNISRVPSIVATIALCACATLRPTTAMAQTMFGRYDCGQWTTGEKRNAAETWLTGYMSGLSTMHAFSVKDSRDPVGELNSMDQAFVWVDSYCKANPLKGLHQAGYDLFKELRATRRK